MTRLAFYAWSTVGTVLLAAACGGSGSGSGGPGSSSGSGGSSSGSGASSSGSGSGSGSGSSGSGAGSGSSASSGASSSGFPGGSSGQGDGGAKSEAGSTSTVTIDFDELPDSTTITNQYAQYATFASQDRGSVVAFDPLDLGQSMPNFICSDTKQCDTGYVVAFAKGVSALRFDAIGVNSTGAVATIQIHQGSTSTSIPLVGQGQTMVPVHVDLSGYSNVTEVDVVNIMDLGGIGLDTFVFDLPN
jgi:hypothetical protein